MPLRAFLLFAAAPCLAAAAATDAADVATWAADEEVCQPDDVECALSLRQLRATALEPEEGAEAGSGSGSGEEGEEGGHPAVAAAEAEASEASSEDRVTSLVNSLHKKKNVKTLYHLTSPHICQLIKQGGFKPGSNGWCGGAIYFATSVKSVWTKAVGVNSHTGCLLQVKVDVGKVKNMPPTCDLHMTKDKLYATKHSSIRFNPGDGIEYVIFDPRQVLSVKQVWKDPKLGSNANGLAPVRVDANGVPIRPTMLVEEEAATPPEKDEEVVESSAP